MATLFDYYKGQGKSLPSISERAGLFQQYGLGSSGEYRGTADQNTRLLAALGGGQSTTPAPATVNTSTGSYSITPTTATMADYMPTAKAYYESVYDPYKQVLEGQIASNAEIFAKQRSATESALPLIQQRYDNLLKELEAKDLETQGEIKEEGEAAVGETRARAGARGVFSSGIEIGQEANIGNRVAKLIKSQAEGTQRQKAGYAVAQGEEENKIRSILADLASSESQSGFQIRQAIAAIGPEMMDKAISLAAKLMTDKREGEELALAKEKFSWEKSQAGKGSATQQSLASLKVDAASGLTVNQLVAKYAGLVDGNVIADVYDAASPYGPMNNEERNKLYGIRPDIAEAGATTADAIDQVIAKGNRDSALKELNAKKSAWEKAGVDSTSVQNAIDTYYPAPVKKEQTNNSSGKNLWTAVWEELKKPTPRWF